eukprot:scaffold616_cov257-Pinguiococcus_pyrenoidosus.AAC.25
MPEQKSSSAASESSHAWMFMFESLTDMSKLMSSERTGSLSPPPPPPSPSELDVRSAAVVATTTMTTTVATTPKRNVPRCMPKMSRLFGICGSFPFPCSSSPERLTTLSPAISSSSRLWRPCEAGKSAGPKVRLEALCAECACGGAARYASPSAEQSRASYGAAVANFTGKIGTWYGLEPRRGSVCVNSIRKCLAVTTNT